MEENKKKMIMIVIIVVCIVAAVIITVATQSGRSAGGIESLKRGEAMFWVKCRNSKCENTWQMDKKDYFDYLEKHRVTMAIPPIVCPKCSEESGYRAEKCEKCGFIFERGSVPNDIADRCPKCNFSAMEDLRKQAGAAVEKPATTPATTEEKK